MRQRLGTYAYAPTSKVADSSRYSIEEVKSELGHIKTQWQNINYMREEVCYELEQSHCDKRDFRFHQFGKRRLRFTVDGDGS